MAKEKLVDLPLTFVDTETTGLDPDKGARLLEIALVRVERGQVTDTFTTLVDAGVDVPDYITDVNRITNDDLVGAPKFADVADAVTQRMAGTTVVAHNLTFDWKFLVAEYKRAGLQAPDAPGFCTLELAREMLTLPRHRLVDCCDHYGITLDGAHAALADTVACAEVAQKLLELAETRGGGTVDLDEARPGRDVRPWRTENLRAWFETFVPTDQLVVPAIKPRG